MTLPQITPTNETSPEACSPTESTGVTKALDVDLTLLAVEQAAKLIAEVPVSSWFSWLTDVIG